MTDSIQDLSLGTGMTPVSASDIPTLLDIGSSFKIEGSLPPTLAKKLSWLHSNVTSPSDGPFEILACC
jgi:hypothetical protein